MKRAFFLLLWLVSIGWSVPGAVGASTAGPFKIPVLLVHYFPVSGTNIDIEATGDWGQGLEATREKTQQVTRELIQALTEGSRYKGYTNPTATPSLEYNIAGTYEFLEPLPVITNRPGRTPMTDYNSIVKRVDVRKWVEDRGVKEVWIWAYHGGKVDLWESNMSSPTGDVSNSDRNETDLPVLSRTYTVYHYNYQRGTSEAVENHIHQIEAVLNHVDGRDTAAPDQWPELLFWGKFVGSDRSHKIVRPGAGWAHYPPNGERDYDWANKRFVETDIDDWRPDGAGVKISMNCDRWQCRSLPWFIYWMQHLPGANNGLTYAGKPLQNWWQFIGNYDAAMAANLKLSAR